MNKVNLPTKAECCGCAACVDICPKGAISLQEDSGCYYNIKVDEDKCVGCRLCETHCHILHPERLKKSNPLDVQPLAAWSTDEERIKNSASGGIFAQVAYNMLSEDDNTFVYGATLLEDNSTRHIEISSVDDIALLQNSKYQQSVSTGIYKQVKMRLKQGARVLFSGIPCQVAGLYSFLGDDERLREKLFTIEILCHGVPNNDLHRTALKVNKASRIVAYRNKEGIGWGGWSSRLTYLDHNGQKFIIQTYIDDSLFRSYLTCNFLRENCYQCHYADIHRVADMTIGDYWLWERTPNPDKYRNYWGTSFVLPNTAKGRQMMKGPHLSTTDTTWREFMPVNQNLYMPTNAYEFKGCRIMPILKHLPTPIKNIIYRRGFSHYRPDRLYHITMRLIFWFRTKHRRQEQADKIEETLKYLERQDEQ